ncbi:MAG TPA: tRNA pseudouridine(13) synthase TruD [Cellvibrionaceae bacterium]|nr:tRNA pseudouridine(13) synthase TruD [Cellvibrionaceae bacterium]HNG59284.1 tRNA pseudouridine(13) synthase TruD [Cellvibrionaceae bacterium]
MAERFMFDTYFPLYHGAPLGNADFRCHWDDFVVDEELPPMDLGAGEHVYLQIRKRGINTEWLARQLAERLKIAPNDVGFCGLKDRHATTSQWFSLYLPKVKELDGRALLPEIEGELELLQQTRGSKKLRRGMHKANHFVIHLRHYSGCQDAFAARLELIRQQGVPNYFGEQRFGIEGQNLLAAKTWLEEKQRIKRSLEGIYLSSLRSYIFNAILRARLASAPLEELQTLSGALWGRGRLPAEYAEFETQALHADLAPLLNALEHKGLNQERRPLWLQVADLTWQFPGPDQLQLRFSLAPGQYTTSLLRESVHLRDMSVKIHS